MFNIMRKCQTDFQSDFTILYSQQQCITVQFAPYLLQKLLFFCLFSSSHLSGCEVVSHIVFDFVFSQWLINYVEHLFIWLLAIRMSSLKKCLFNRLFLIGLFSFYCCKISFCILVTTPLSDLWLVNYFSHFECCLFTSLVLNFNAVQFVYFFLHCLCFCVMSKRRNLRSQKFTPMFSANNFTILVLIFKFDSFWVNFYKRHEVVGQDHSLACGYPVVHVPII